MNTTRREFVSRLTLAGTAGLLGGWPETVDAEPPPETTKLVLRRPPTANGLCVAPLWVAEEFLRTEGFTEVQYPKKGRTDSLRALASGEIHMDMGFLGDVLMQVDAGEPVVLLAGIHIGCFALPPIGSGRCVI